MRSITEYPIEEVEKGGRLISLIRSLFLEENLTQYEYSSDVPHALEFLEMIIVEFLEKMKLDLYQFLEKEADLQKLEQEALLSIRNKFSKIEKVKSIYVQKFREEIQIYILLSIEKYDGELMDRLLDIEYEIRKMYPEIVFEFFYPPVGVVDKKDFIHPSAQCIYTKF